MIELIAMLTLIIFCLLFKIGGCTIEILVNRTTYDDLRSINNICHHKDGICHPDRCACSDDCKEFTWNFTAGSGSVNHTFGCGSRILEDGKTYKANTSLIWTGSNFIILEQSYQLIYSEITTSGLSTKMPELKQPLSVASITGILVSCVVLICSITIYCFLKRTPKKAKAPERYSSHMEPVSKPFTLSVQTTDSSTQYDNPNHVKESTDLSIVHTCFRESADEPLTFELPNQVVTDKRESNQSENSQGSEKISVISSNKPLVNTTDDSDTYYTDSVGEEWSS